MKYCYCPRCDNLRPKGWLLRSHCEICQGDCIIFTVKRSLFGLVAYAFYILALAAIGLYAGRFMWSSSWADFYDVSSNEAILILIGLYATGLVLSFIDLGRTNAEAQRIKGKMKLEQASKERGP